MPAVNYFGMSAPVPCSQSVCNFLATTKSSRVTGKLLLAWGNIKGLLNPMALQVNNGKDDKLTMVPKFLILSESSHQIIKSRMTLDSL